VADRHQHERLEVAGVLDASHVDGGPAEGLAELGHGLLGGLVVAADENIWRPIGEAGFTMCRLPAVL
jgi:hypothetical protein